MYVFQLKNVSVYYNRVCALKDINLKIEEGEFLGIIGPNGGGKTTLLKVLLGLVKPSAGEVIVNSNPLMGYVPQYSAFNRYFPINVLDVVLTGMLKKPLKPFHRYTPEDVKKADSIMERLGILELRKRHIRQLSGGQVQKILIARALTAQPDILLLDEPTANIDAHSRTEIFELLEKLNEHMTIVMVSHDLSAVSCYVNSIACLNQKLLYHGDARLTGDRLEKVYGCPVDLIHGFPQRIPGCHKERIS